MTSPNPQEGGKHTPGEWRAEREVDLNGVETGRLWIVMRGAPCAYDFDRYEDAVLAAAAPALLEALKGAIGALEFSRDYHSDLGNEEQAFCQDKLDAALKATAQATGGENGR